MNSPDRRRLKNIEYKKLFENRNIEPNEKPNNGKS
jgi:hypothetical protein